MGTSVETIFSKGKHWKQLKWAQEDQWRTMFSLNYGEGQRGWEFYQRNMEEYGPVSWKRACHITSSVWSINLWKVQCGMILKNWTLGRVQSYASKDTIPSIYFIVSVSYSYSSHKFPLLSLSPSFISLQSSTCYICAHVMEAVLITLIPKTFNYYPGCYSLLK